MRILNLGAGYTASFLADEFGSEHDVVFLTRRPDELRAQGRKTLNLKREIEQDFPEGKFDLILDTVPAVFTGAEKIASWDPPYRQETEEILSRFPRAVTVHISSTSVYPGGGVAADPEDLESYDENTPPDPTSPQGEKRLLLENRLRELYPSLRIARSGGIYGPGRALALRFLEGDFGRTGGENRIVSRIHVLDLVRVCLALAERPGNPDLVNAVDPHPSSNRETFLYLEEILGITIPGEWRKGACRGRFIRSLYASDLLGGGFRFPSYREGFADVLAKRDRGGA